MCRRGSGASDLTKASTWDSTWTLTFIEAGHVLHLRLAGLVLPNGFHRFRIAHDLKGLDDGLHPLARQQDRDGAPMPRDAEGPFAFRSADALRRLGLQLRDSYCRI